MRIVLLKMLFVSLVLAATTRSQEDDFLDLTKVQAVKTREAIGPLTGGGVSTGGMHSRPSKFVPLQITLLSLDKQSYLAGAYSFLKAALG